MDNKPYALLLTSVICALESLDCSYLMDCREAKRTILVGDPDSDSMKGTIELYRSDAGMNIVCKGDNDLKQLSELISQGLNSAMQTEKAAQSAANDNPANVH